MNRMDYNGDYDPLEEGRWKARINKVMRGRPAQTSFRELEAALLDLPSKRLIEGSVCRDGEVCAIGAYALYKRQQAGERYGDILVDLQARYDGEGGIETALLGERLGMTYTLSYVIAELNDEDFRALAPEERYVAVLHWVQKRIVREPS